MPNDFDKFDADGSQFFAGLRRQAEGEPYWYHHGRNYSEPIIRLIRPYNTTKEECPCCYKVDEIGYIINDHSESICNNCEQRFELVVENEYYEGYEDLLNDEERDYFNAKLKVLEKDIKQFLKMSL